MQTQLIDERGKYLSLVEHVWRYYDEHQSNSFGGQCQCETCKGVRHLLLKPKQEQLQLAES